MAATTRLTTWWVESVRALAAACDWTENWTP